ncbi:MAG TPA: CPBP family intramembrane glutamic endopeptidase [Candidatus Acidoferrales bacterium]
MNRLGLAAQDETKPLTAPQRGLSLVELAIGSFIVVGHNVLHIVPNEVPILFVIGIISIRLREGNWRAIGLARPKSWGRTIAIAVGAAALVILVGQFVSDPLARVLGLHANPGSAANALGAMKGNLWTAAKGLALVWTFAAFGEEISYRRYLLGRAADLGNRSPAAYWIGLLYVSALFGIGHFYQGPAGIFSTAVDGFIIGAAYLLSRRNLWVAVLTHGFVDTFAIVLLFFGLAN